MSTIKNITSNLSPEIIKNQLSNSERLKLKYLSLYKKNKDLISSLNYAKVIQNGVLPKERHFKKLFKDYFILYESQSYVSGDFYWIGEVNDCSIFAVGDCTGHGVPGALLTMLAQSFLNYIILGKQIHNPSEILKEFDKKFIETFSNDDDDTFHNDWIDIALCCYDKEKNTLHFAGAKRKILIVSNNEPYLYAGSNYPIGGWQLEQNRTFDLHSIQIQTNDIVYIGSDGFQDQIGGEKNKKFGSKNLHKLLTKIASFSSEEQKKLLKNTFENWKSSSEQLDDVCIMGIRF